MMSGHAHSDLPAQRILIVDDEPLVLDSIRMLLELDGHTLETASSGREALEKFVPGKFDVVITDFSMPDMNGNTLARAVRERSPTQPIMMISAYSESITAGGKKPEQIDVILDKPFSLEALRQGVRAALQARRA